MGLENVPEKTDTDTETGLEVTVCQMKSASQFSMNIQVSDREKNTVVDTAAEVKIISDKVYQSLKKPPPTLRDVKLLIAGRKMGMNVLMVGPVKLNIGSQWYAEQLYV